MGQLTFLFDEDDERAIHEAIAKRQNLRVHGACILPEGQSDTAGAVLAEICRGWLELMGLNSKGEC